MKTIEDIDKKCNWFIEYSEKQKCMHVESEFDRRSRPHKDWELVEAFFGTELEAHNRANALFKKVTKSRNQ